MELNSDAFSRQALFHILSREVHDINQRRLSSFSTRFPLSDIVQPYGNFSTKQCSPVLPSVLKHLFVQERYSRKLYFHDRPSITKVTWNLSLDSFKTRVTNVRGFIHRLKNNRCCISIIYDAITIALWWMCILAVYSLVTMKQSYR